MRMICLRAIFVYIYALLTGNKADLFLSWKRKGERKLSDLEGLSCTQGIQGVEEEWGGGGGGAGRRPSETWGSMVAARCHQLARCLSTVESD